MASLTVGTVADAAGAAGQGNLRYGLGTAVVRKIRLDFGRIGSRSIVTEMGQDRMD